MFDTPMIRCGTTERSHEEVQLRAARIAAGLRPLGVRRATTSPSSWRTPVEFLEVTAGVALAGANPVPVNWHWKSEELGYLLSNSGSTAAFVHSDFVAAVEQTGTSIPLVVVNTANAPVPGSRVEYEAWLAENEPAEITVAPSTDSG